MKPQIVYVDDIENNLILVEATLGDEWDVKAFRSPHEALAQLPQLHPSVILSDQTMDGMSGVEFLEKSMKIQPYAVRVIITGYSEEELVIDSVRVAKVFDYIRKPYKEGELQNRVNRALEHHEQLWNARLELDNLAKENRSLTKKTEDLLALNNELRREIDELKKR